MVWNRKEGKGTAVLEVEQSVRKGGGKAGESKETEPEVSDERDEKKLG